MAISVADDALLVRLPKAGSRDAQLWCELLLPIYLKRFPHLRLQASDHVATLIDQFLEALNVYYEAAAKP